MSQTFLFEPEDTVSKYLDMRLKATLSTSGFESRISQYSDDTIKLLDRQVTRLRNSSGTERHQLVGEIIDLHSAGEKESRFEFGKERAGLAVFNMPDSLGARADRDKFIGYEVFLGRYGSLDEVEGNLELIEDPIEAGFASVIFDVMNKTRDAYFRGRMKDIRAQAV